MIMYVFEKINQKKKKAKKNLLWFYLRSPDILLREVSCNIIKGDPIKIEDSRKKHRNYQRSVSEGESNNQII